MIVLLAILIKQSKTVKNKLIYCEKNHINRQITVKMNENERNILTDCARLDKIKL